MADNYESIQLVAFLSVPPSEDALAIWQKAFGQPPSSFSTQMPGSTQAQGIIGAHSVTLVVQPIRVDVVVAGNSVGAPSPVPPVLTDLDSGLQLALTQMLKVVPLLKVGRAAAVIQGHTICSSGVDTVVELQKSLPGVRIPNACADLSYQVIVPRDSTRSHNRKLNQLCRWQTIQMQMFQLQPQAFSALNATFAAHTYIDIYGVDMEQLTDAEAASAVDEVAGRAKEIILGGLNELG